MRLIFTNVRRENPSRDGFDFQYFYRVEDDNTIHSIYIVTTSDGAELAWNISEHDLYEYSKRAFALVVDFIKHYWNHHNQLPDESQKYFENKELGQLGANKVDWKDYILYLN